jgi:hypothetical protein
VALGHSPPCVTKRSARSSNIVYHRPHTVSRCCRTYTAHVRKTVALGHSPPCVTKRSAKSRNDFADPDVASRWPLSVSRLSTPSRGRGCEGCGLAAQRVAAQRWLQGSVSVARRRTMQQGQPSTPSGCRFGKRGLISPEWSQTFLALPFRKQGWLLLRLAPPHQSGHRR